MRAAFHSVTAWRGKGTYHIITYVCSAVIKHKIKSSFTAIFKWINTLQRKSQNDSRFELQDSVRCSIPEAVKYYEFRDPLLSQDYYY